MWYVDTSLLVSLHIHDQGTGAALNWLESVGSEPILTSQGALVEFASALGILVRRRDISLELHHAALDRLRRLTAVRLTMEVPEAEDFRRAAGWLERAELGLRAGDAIHLAICARCAATMCTADVGLARAAEALGVAGRLVRSPT
jgi:predicted nucleic acid-binding protein